MNKETENSMERANRYGGVDYFRIVAAFLIVAIHTAPLSSWTEGGDFLLTYCLGRLAGPFVLVTTGYFVLGAWRRGGCEGAVCGRYWMRTLALYLIATVLYLPVNIYSGQLPGNVDELGQMLLLDGTFYHLWYLPAVLIAYPLVAAISRKIGLLPTGILALAAYLAGLMGDSWFGLADQWGPAHDFYQALFQYIGYTRNGLFYAPIFLVLGAWMASWRRKPAVPLLGGGLVVSLALLLGEGWLTWSQGWQRHNSMYLMLLPAVVVLFALLLRVPGEAPSVLRPLSQWIYVLHPLAIILVRGLARATGSVWLLVENSLAHFLAVCVLSTGLSLMLIQWLLWRQERAAARRAPQSREAAEGPEEEAEDDEAEEEEGMEEDMEEGTEEETPPEP